LDTFNLKKMVIHGTTEATEVDPEYKARWSS